MIDYYQTKLQLAQGRWCLITRCRECKKEIIMQTEERPYYCPMCGKGLGELYCIEEEEKHEIHS